MAKAKIYLDKRRPLKGTNSYPIRIRVTDNKERKYYSTGHHADEKTFQKLMNLNIDLRGTNKIVREQVEKILNKAETIIKNMEVFSFSLFEESFRGNKEKDQYYIWNCFEQKVIELNRQERAGTASSYADSYKSFKRFTEVNSKRSNPKFGDITVQWLDEYESWMRSDDHKSKNNAKAYQKSWSTIGIYSRNLRSLFNEAIKKGLFEKSDFYPFGKYQFVIPGNVNVKKAMTFDHINKIYNLDLNDNELLLDSRTRQSLSKWKDFWMLSYLCNGVNFKDVASWKWLNYDQKSGKMKFERQKTRNTTKENKELIIISLMDQAKEIIFRHCNDDREANKYIFPFYDNSMDAQQKLKVSKQQVKNINKAMSRISKVLEFDVKITYQTARHSFATISRNAGVDIGYISQALGHQDLKTTDKYLASFEEEKIKENQNHLLGTNIKTFLKVAT